MKELRTAILMFVLCALSYAIFVFVVFGVKEMVVRGVGMSGVREEGFGGDGVGGWGRMGGMVRGRRMFENKGH